MTSIEPQTQHPSQDEMGEGGKGGGERIHSTHELVHLSVNSIIN